MMTPLRKHTETAFLPTVVTVGMCVVVWRAVAFGGRSPPASLAPWS